MAQKKTDDRRSLDGGRWTRLSLNVYRGVGETATYAIVHRRAESGVYRDRMLAHGVFPCPPGSQASSSWLEALCSALSALTDTDITLRPKGVGVPQGPQGGLPGTPLD